MHHFGPDTDPDNDRETVWTLAKRSRRTVVGLGLLFLGALLMSLPARDLLRGDRDARWLAGIGLFLLLLGGLLARAGWRRAKGQLRIVRKGIETEATVTAVARARLQPTGSRYDFSTRAGTQIIRYSYVDGSGTAHQGKSVPAVRTGGGLETWRPRRRAHRCGESGRERLDGTPPPALTLARPKRRAHVPPTDLTPGDPQRDPK